MINNVLALAPVKTVVDLYSRLETKILLMNPFTMPSHKEFKEWRRQLRNSPSEVKRRQVAATYERIRRQQEMRQIKKNFNISFDLTFLLLFIISLPVAYFAYTQFKKLSVRQKELTEEYTKSLYGTDPVLKPYAFQALKNKTEIITALTLFYFVLMFMPVILLIKLLFFDSGLSDIFEVLPKSTIIIALAGIALIMITIVFVYSDRYVKKSIEQAKKGTDDLKSDGYTESTEKELVDLNINGAENSMGKDELTDEQKEKIEKLKKTRDDNSYLFMATIAILIFIAWTLLKSEGFC